MQILVTSVQSLTIEVANLSQHGIKGVNYSILLEVT